MPCRLIACLLVLFCTVATAARPELYRELVHESPVRGQPDDLVLLAGYNLAVDNTVVYRLIGDTTKGLAAPARPPATSDAHFGLAPVVSTADVPYSLTVRLPGVMRANQSYALWVRSASGQWSLPVRINDARPLWVTPAYVFASEAVAGLPRELKIVGRNLEASPGRSTQIRLVGPENVAAAAVVDTEAPAVLSEYVARMPLPARLRPGEYRIQISRDGVSWVDLSGELFEVLPDPAPAAEFSVSDTQFGGCRPDDGRDDTACIVRAIAAASNAGGGIVYFASGVWDLIDSTRPGVSGASGIVVPPGVQLRGDGSAQTRLQRNPQWNARVATAVFTLKSHTSVTGFTFHDLQTYRTNDPLGGAYLQIGETWQRIPTLSGAEAMVSDVTITRNVFDRPYVAIGGGGLPIARLFLTYNTFGAFHSAVELSGDWSDLGQPYRLDDSVIDYNVFKPGSDLDPVHKSGTVASELGAGKRVDFSGNTADGTATDFLYSPDDAKGWRATFFWSPTNNVEEVLISQNTATCTGDKIGDGEAIAFDNNNNTFGFKDIPTVADATSDSVTVPESLVGKQHGLDIPVSDYYVDQWVQVVSGSGLGQVRKITAYSTDPITNRTTIKITPNWDVLPTPGASRISLGREYWQLYVVGNHIDNRRPLCQKSNRSRLAAGQIVMWAQSADSVIAGNDQHDSNGILVQQNFGFVHANSDPAEQPCGDCTAMSFSNYFLQIHDNVIDGEYDWGNDCSSSGIELGVAAAPWNGGPPPTVGFGVSISHNIVQHADGLAGGAISQLSTWWGGPAPHRWPLSDSLLIDHNTILDIDGPSAVAICGKSHARIGIAFPDAAITWHTVLYANSCKNVSTPIGGTGVATVKVCPSSVSNSCECPPTGQ